MSETAAPPAVQAPTVYFIDDSATMREVIKIAFRRENINVITCHDAATALAQIPQQSPDMIITDVIMPDMDGYAVCQFIKQHPQLGGTPVILMSGVVDRAVAEKAMGVKADELIRKPFQPQELIARVKSLLNPASAPAGGSAAASAPATSPLSGMFGGNGAAAPPRPSVVAPTMPAAAAPSAGPRAVTPSGTAVTPRVATRPAAPPTPLPAAPAGPQVQKLRAEIQRLDLLVNKLRSELEAEREYSKSLEVHIKTLTDAD